ncbi:hypothetical protein [Thermomonospora catenispora]|uniref:hypothetical protein n=1 Tax=Thermomonospora catenispora TaxID=2493090 RepID=UPI00112381C4|nr:hypothetical protein [Thermomonospora catenispora]TNY34548.1 hypothetical protein EIO00_23185 [Thermomonospora catenispora]
MSSGTTVAPETLHDLEMRARRVHPDEPAACAREVLTLVRQVRQLDAQAATQEAALERVRALALDWTASPDIMQAAAGRLVLAALAGRASGRGLI